MYKLQFIQFLFNCLLTVLAEHVKKLPGGSSLFAALICIVTIFAKVRIIYLRLPQK